MNDSIVEVSSERMPRLPLYPSFSKGGTTADSYVPRLRIDATNQWASSVQTNATLNRCQHYSKYLPAKVSNIPSVSRLLVAEMVIGHSRV
jgi:hypothetical protein